METDDPICVMKGGVTLRVSGRLGEFVVSAWLVLGMAVAVCLVCLSVLAALEATATLRSIQELRDVVDGIGLP